LGIPWKLKKSFFMIFKKIDMTGSQA